jgi:hypothetical protein
MNDRQRLEAIVAVVCKYLPPNGISRKDAMREIIGLVDPLPEQPKEKLVCDKDPFYCWSISCQMGKVCNHTASPKREWVGLTDDEVAQIEKTVLTRKQAVKMIEHHLKERNT